MPTSQSITRTCVPSPGEVVPRYDAVTVAWFSKLMRFSSVFGWWMPTADVPFAPVASQPDHDTSNDGSTGVSSSTSVKSEGALDARKKAPVLNCASEPSPGPPLEGLPAGRHVEFS